jgi:PAS domain S-box-containing protein
MSRKPTYEEVKQVVKDLNKESSERRLVEEELNIVYAALNSAASGVMITDKKGIIKYANPTFLRMFEYEFEKQVTGKYADELFAHQGRRRFIDMESIIDKSKGETEIFPALRKDGTIFHVEVSTSSITDNEGHDVGRMASFVDITEREQMEEALKEGSRRGLVGAWPGQRNNLLYINSKVPATITVTSIVSALLCNEQSQPVKHEKSCIMFRYPKIMEIEGIGKMSSRPVA